MMKWWNKISHLGINSRASDIEFQRILLANRLTLILLLFSLSSLSFNIFLRNSTFIPALICASALLAANFWWNYKQHFLPTKISLVVVPFLLLNYMLLKGARGAGLEFYFLSLSALPPLLFDKKKYTLSLLSLLLGAYLFHTWYLKFILKQEPDIFIFHFFFILNTFYAGLLFILAVVFYKQIARHQEEVLLKVNTSLNLKTEALEHAQKIAHIGSWEWDILNNRIFWSDELFRIFGITPRTFKPSFSDYIQRVHEDDKAFTEEIIKNALLDLKPFSFTHRIVSKEGVLKVLDCKGLVINDQQGKPVRLQGTSADITAQKKLLEKQNELLSELKSRNQELGEFAFMFSHDLKTPLRSISMLTDMMIRDEVNAISPEGLSRLKQIKERISFSWELIEGMLSYSEITGLKEEPRWVDLKEMVQEIEKNIECPENIKIQIDNLPELFFERSLLTQLFLNLMANAVKFMDKEQGLIRIWAEKEEDFWKIAVSDNGPGIEERYYQKVFQLFQKLNKNKNEGTGIGLSIVKKIMEAKGGKVKVESVVGQGTTFTLFFPLKRERLAIH